MTHPRKATFGTPTQPLARIRTVQHRATYYVSRATRLEAPGYHLDGLLIRESNTGRVAACVRYVAEHFPEPRSLRRFLANFSSTPTERVDGCIHTYGDFLRSEVVPA